MAEGVSENLMDYNDSGTRLHKYQWDFIHNLEGGLYVFQDEEEGASYSVIYQDFKTSNSYNVINSEKDFVSFLAPSGLPISLPVEAKNFQFNEELYW